MPRAHRMDELNAKQSAVIGHSYHLVKQRSFVSRKDYNWYDACACHPFHVACVAVTVGSSSLGFKVSHVGLILINTRIEMCMYSLPLCLTFCLVE